MYAEITAALSSIKVASDLAALVLKAKVDSAVTQKAIELQSAVISLQATIMSLQAQNQDLLQQNNELKQRLMNLENWDAEAKKYSLTDVSSGVFVYMIKPDQIEGSPTHWLCAHCFENKQKSIIQRGPKTIGGWPYSCPRCKVEIITHNKPSQATDT